MAKDYEVSSNRVFAETDGDLLLVSDYPPGTFFGGSDTDDGNWNVGDPLTDGNNLEYQGSYTADGHLFLVFMNASVHSIFSPTAPSTSSGYPSHYTSDPPPALTTTPLATCFAQGTVISCPDGERRVESLQIGDAVLTAAGKVVSVRWIGRQTLDMRLPDAGRNCPVRIRAGALGNGLPHSDLTVTADHGLVLDGLVINASALVNGSTIDYVPLPELPETFTVYHVETDAHDVILANGAPAETFIDYRDRRAFDNYQEYLDLYGCERIIPEMPAPRTSSGRHLPEQLRQRLQIGSEISVSPESLTA